jgi:hypothetical protein
MKYVKFASVKKKTCADSSSIILYEKYHTLIRSLFLVDFICVFTPLLIRL